jgi:uncharacterized surface protein with fasciclin (FAS1) repeats
MFENLPKWFVASAFALSLPLAGCGGDSGAESRAMESEEMAAGAEQEAMAMEEAEARGDIVETAEAAGQFRTLLTAAEAAGLVETLRGPGPYTVFAPTDEAFEELPEGTVDELLQPENRDRLRKLLSYHVVPGDVRSDEVATMRSAPTVAGDELPIQAEGDRVRVGDATVVQPDVEASNGRIHVIDRVLVPPPA